jgi:hypothetical protein
VKLTLSVNDIEWVVNDSGELGVKIGTQVFFMYKGEAIAYGSFADTRRDGIAIHDNGTQMKWRAVQKREFGESGPTVKVDVDDGLDWRLLPASQEIE